MENKKLNKYYIFSAIGILAASFYPLYMGVCVVSDMITNGTVMKEDYPKYIIPYTPISLALIMGILLMPLLMKYIRHPLFLASILSVAVFFGAELLLENKVVVTTSSIPVELDDWQMYMCMSVGPIGSKGIGSYSDFERYGSASIEPVAKVEGTQTAAEILMGNYNPAFKLHFYVISLLLILSVLNCFYGFAYVIQSGEKKKLRTLVMQAISSGIFLGLCILACFTAFFRNGQIQVSFISAALMTVFFVLFGINAGIYEASFLHGKNKRIFIMLPAVTASLMTAIMYIGELILLSGHLYRFGKGFLFRGLWSGIRDFNPDGMFNLGLAPIDFIIILAAGIICAGILRFQKPGPEGETLGKEDEL